MKLTSVAESSQGLYCTIFATLTILPPTAVAQRAMTHRTHSCIFAQPLLFQNIGYDNCDYEYGVLHLPLAKTLGVTGVYMNVAQHVLSCKEDETYFKTVLDLHIA